MKTKEEVLKETSQFYGTEQYHRFSAISLLVITDGVQFIANNYKVYWWLDIIASYQGRLKKVDMQVWTLKVNDSNEGIVTCTDGNNKQLVKQDIPYTDCEAEEMIVWVMNEVIFLPSEY